MQARCLKIKEKVSFSIRSEASYILSGQKLSKNAKIGQFGEVLKIEVCGQTVLTDRSVLMVEIAQN